MKKRKILLLCALFLLRISFLHAIDFQDLNLSADDRLLFRANIKNQHTLFISRLTDFSIQQLTAFPEKLKVVDNGRTLLVQNRFGASSIPVSGGLPVPLPSFPSFATENVPLRGRSRDFAASYDGRWYLFIEPVSPAFGNLFLVEMSSGLQHLVSENVELPSSNFPARWSPDSGIFVYSKNSRLYYFPVIQNISAMVDERFRHIGPGRITSVLWGSHGDLYYFTANTLYRIMTSELFTRTLYGEFLSIGNVVATLPFEFECGFDQFWIAPDSRAILVNKREKSLFLFQLGENQFNNLILPHVMLPQGLGNIKVLWPGGRQRQLTVISSLQDEIKAWRFEINGRNIAAFSPQNVPLSANAALSPDGTKVIFWSQNGLELWDYANWRLIQRLSGDNILSGVWINNREFAIGSERFIKVINITGSEFTRRIICLAGADEFGFEESAGFPRIFARAGNEWFSTNGLSPWTSAVSPRIKTASLASDRFRVFLASQTAGPFRNIPMIRSIVPVATRSLFENFSINNAYSLSAPMRIALCFDLYNDDTGLSQVLNALERFNIRATFFMNGDFIRRNPHAAAAIANAGHEAASMFFAPIDLSDVRFQVTPQFILQGLARNEDEFFRATGMELSPIWRPPFFRTNAMINAAAVSAGYLTSRRDVDSGDWMSRSEALRLGVRLLSASQTIEYIISQKHDRAIIPVRLGLNPGGRDDYLFQHIDVLIDALLRSGAEIVPVSAVLR